MTGYGVFGKKAKFAWSLAAVGFFAGVLASCSGGRGLSLTVEAYTKRSTVGTALKHSVLAAPGFEIPAFSITDAPTGFGFTLHVGDETREYTAGEAQTAGGTIDIEYDDALLNAFATEGQTIEIHISAGSEESRMYAFTYEPSKTHVWQDLQAMDLAGSYTLAGNIDLPIGYNFDPVGDSATPFTGTLDGDGYAVRNLHIDRSDRDDVGLIGSVGAGGTVRNIGVETGAAGIKGRNSVGGLVGYNEGTVQGYAMGAVTGINSVGGLVGFNQGTVQGYATGAARAENTNVGGLVGQNWGTVQGYATGAVTARNGQVGGLVGRNDGIVQGYATGTVTGNDRVGGLVGNSTTNAVGYARGDVIRTKYSINTRFGRVIGDSDKGYYSAQADESNLKETDSADTIIDATFTPSITSVSRSIDINAGDYAQSSFIGTGGNVSLSFGTAVGEWTFTAGKWPAINLPPEVGGQYAAGDQPIE